MQQALVQTLVQAEFMPALLPTVDLRNNIIVNSFTPNGTGLAIAYRRSSTTLTSYSALSNNNSFYAGTPSATNLIYYDGTNSDQTMGDYKTRVSPRDAASFSENVPFVNSGQLLIIYT